MSTAIRWFRAGMFLTIGSMAYAGGGLDVSPALDSHPGGLLETVRRCAEQEHLFVIASDPVDHLEAWFREFRNPAYPRILSELHHSRGNRYTNTLNRAHALVDEVRHLTDFRTEQALIAMMDAVVRKYGEGSGCREAASRLFLRIAAQRDRAWAWAEVVDRFLEMGEERWETELRTRRVADSLRRVERSYRWFEKYRK